MLHGEAAGEGSSLLDPEPSHWEVPAGARLQLPLLRFQPQDVEAHFAQAVHTGRLDVSASRRGWLVG